MRFNTILTKKDGIDCMKPLKDKVSITLDSDIVQKIKDMAEDDDRNFSQYINMVLRDWIKRQENNEYGK